MQILHEVVINMSAGWQIYMHVSVYNIYVHNGYMHALGARLTKSLHCKTDIHLLKCMEPIYLALSPKGLYCLTEAYSLDSCFLCIDAWQRRVECMIPS